uniref:Cobyrinic acid a,c-diamide synthase n=1 Tax=Odontella aurita TaxID=265563 RepID=A0A7S4N165_9STRA|mmetsp:Transcript_4329/g.12090  ORF Transcript_4329/g.12090 Transcript_4329/m.12090 type:complete len:401 (+) Transcript_4329:230-1432(+)
MGEDKDEERRRSASSPVSDGDAFVPALFLSAPASGQGKTTIAASLARLLTRRGKAVRIFKKGPDYLDPQILERATTGGAAAGVVQLDMWMCGEEWCRDQLYRAATTKGDGGGGGGGGADIILVEGAMGLYDGNPSSADLAAKFGIPVALIMDVRAMAQTAAAIAVGLRNYRDDFTMAGVIANYCGSDYHGRLVRDALPDDLPLWAALRKTDDVKLPERHLGLDQPCELQGDEDAIERRLEAGADLLEKAGILKWIDTLGPVRFRPQRIAPPCRDALAGRTIAVARDDAFSFIYSANTTLLTDMGASVLFFSPLNDSSVPPSADAVWLPGGYPELHAARLSRNTSMLSSLRSFHRERGGKPILAECGGFLYCMETLIDLDGARWPMAGIMAGCGTMRNRAG